MKGGGGLSCPEASVIGGDQNVSAVFVFIYVMSKMIFKFRRLKNEIKCSLLLIYFIVFSN